MARLNAQVRYWWLALAIFSGAGCLIATSLHYQNIWHGNSWTWISWLITLILLFAAVLSREGLRLNKLPEFSKTNIQILLCLGALFVLTHYWNFSTAPWNYNGIFDDAAWDIYFAKRYIFSGAPFQAAFWDMEIAREVMFHYYISPFFWLLGDNLASFDIALVLLGLGTFTFSCLLILRLSSSTTALVAGGIILNFLPLHFVHTFVGHRYAAAAPLMTAALYFLLLSFELSSSFYAVLSGILAALGMDSAIMGKQFFVVLLIALLLHLITDFRKIVQRERIKLALLFVVSSVLAMMPLVVYIYYHPEYFRHERSLTQNFLRSFSRQGEGSFSSYVDLLLQVFFGKFSYRREFIPDFPVLPFAYYALLLPGMLYALLRKHYALLGMATLPVAGAFVAGCYDFRVLHAAPFWIVLMAMFIAKLQTLCLPLSGKRQIMLLQCSGLGVAVAVVLAGLLPSISYLHKKSLNPNSIWFFPHKVVALSRYARDLAAGISTPSIAWRPNELGKVNGESLPDYDILLCQKLGYAITHMFLQPYNDRRIMAFCDGLPFNLLNTAEIFAFNKREIANYPQSSAKDLKLIWEIDEKTKPIISLFSTLNTYGSDSILSVKEPDLTFSLYVLNINKENLEEFKKKAAELEL